VLLKNTTAAEMHKRWYFALAEIAGIVTCTVLVHRIVRYLRSIDESN
jgi:hypothetical protein